MVKLKIVDGIHKLSTQSKFQTRVHLRNELSRHSGSSQVAKCSFLMLRAQSSDKRCAAMRSAWEKTPENWQSVVQKGTNVVNNKPKWWDLSPYESYQLKKEKKKSQIMPGKRTWSYKESLECSFFSFFFFFVDPIFSTVTTCRTRICWLSPSKNPDEETRSDKQEIYQTYINQSIHQIGLATSSNSSEKHHSSLTGKMMSAARNPYGAPTLCWLSEITVCSRTSRSSSRPDMWFKSSKWIFFFAAASMASLECDGLKAKTGFSMPGRWT